MSVDLVDSVSFGSATIHFTVEFRRRKHIGITVRPDRSVHVAAPGGLELPEIRVRVRKRAPWILKQQAHFERYRPAPPPRQYLSGETHRYLGRQYRLRIVVADTAAVRLAGRYLTVDVPELADTRVVRNLVDEWYSQHARATFQRRLKVCLEALPELSKAAPPITVRRMQRRWGSCTKSGRILLNIELVQAPVECVDYVIVHELCHLKVPDHSPRFFRLLAKHMPDWQRRKARLEVLGI